MQILMFGWEFPPLISGGLGTACHGITHALTGLGHEITFVMPYGQPEAVSDGIRIVVAQRREEMLEPKDVSIRPKGLSILTVPSSLRPYLNDRAYRSILTGEPVSRLSNAAGHYGADLVAEAVRYGKAAGAVAREHRFDIIHAHDWMTVHAGIEARTISGRPLILHIHSLEYDRSGENKNPDIYEIERYGMMQADRVIAVSQYTKKTIVDRYGVDPAKITVIYNAVSRDDTDPPKGKRGDSTRKTVLFLGRITMQKGPDYFVEAAAMVLKMMPDVTFVMAGAGDMMPHMVERVAELGIGKNFHFTGFLTNDEVEKIYAGADLYVMPSVSEPFGIAPLEAVCSGVPVIISRQSGVSEILRHVLKVDFWDVVQMADKIIATLRHPTMAAEMVERSRAELQHICWEGAAVNIENLYDFLLQGNHVREA
jgi:glycosyltransferase involved in cell wall biosynthesis